MALDRNCPRGHGILETRKVGSLNIEVCSICHGLFVESDEITHIRGRLEEKGYVSTKQDYLSEEASRAEMTSKEPHASCPKCEYSMFEVNAKGILVDFCLSCKSIWFDDGELQRAIKALKDGEEISFAPRISEDGPDIADLMYYFVKVTEEE